MLLHVAVAYPFQLPSRILLDGYNTVCYLYLLKDILVVASCVWFLTLSKMFSSFPQNHHNPLILASESNIEKALALLSFHHHRSSGSVDFSLYFKSKFFFLPEHISG